MLTLTFLGTGTSVGVPVVLCDCEVCRSQDPRDKRWRSSVYIESRSASFLIDTGPEFRLQALRAGIRKIDAVLYTHSHADHILGFDDLRRFSAANGDRMPVYATGETMEDLARTFRYVFHPATKFPGYVRPEPHEIRGIFWIGDNEIVPIPVEHAAVDTVGFLVRQDGRPLVGYISDCKILTAEGFASLKSVDTLILGTPSQNHRFSHLTMNEGIELAHQLKPRQTFFTHLSHEYLHSEVNKKLPPGCALAFDGLSLQI